MASATSWNAWIELPMQLAIPQNAGAARSQRRACIVWGYLPAAALALGSLTVSLLVHLEPTDPQTVTAVFAPWWTAEQAFSAAASVGRVLGVGEASFLVTVNDTRRDLGARLRGAGAIVIVNPTNAPFCGTMKARN